MPQKNKTAAELRSIVADLHVKADAKRAELKDDTPAAAARQIETDHAALVADIEATKRALSEAESAEAAAAQRGTVVDHSEQSRAAVDAERARIAEITEIGKRHAVDEATVATHIRTGSSVPAFKSVVLESLAARQAAQGGPAGGSQNRSIESVGQDETETRREAMAEYIMARAGVRGAAMTERARELYRGMNAIGLVTECLTWRGEKTRGLLPDEIAQRGLMSTSDFPHILANVARKTLRSSYEAAPRTFTRWTRNIGLTDFKTYNIVRRGETPRLALVNEAGEFKRGSITESKETIQLKTYGVVVGLTRQTIINDDLGALVSIPTDFATSAASLESDLVYGALLANAALKQDSKAIFHADHGNLAGSGTAIDIKPLSDMRARMAKQTGLDGKTVLNIMARFLLVPPELESRAEQIVASFVAAKNADVVPESIRSLTPISEARLSVGVANADAGVVASGSATAFYLISDMVDTIVTANLDGQNGPYVENRVGFDVDGVEIKCRHDFAAAAADFRGAQKDPGAA